jgi:4-diphosphocytidyl-2-C-methyl-D-erythritol kinase
VSSAPAPAKLNLTLVVGPRRSDGKHDVATVLQRLALADTIQLEPAGELIVDGFPEDTLVRDALEALAERAGVPPHWRARITKEIPVAAGLGGGSSDAATALQLANATLEQPLPTAQLARLAAALGADVPFFLADGPQLGTGDGSTLQPLALPQEYVVLLVLPQWERKSSTRAVYEDFDRRDGARGFAERRARVASALSPPDLAAFPPNDLVFSPIADDLRALGAFRADVSGAGPVVYGLFADRAAAGAAEAEVRSRGRTWITTPEW